MKERFLKSFFLTLFFISLILIGQNTYSAVDQFLNDTFFQNPAELSQVNQVRLMVGNLFISPSLRFTGISHGETGNAASVAQDNLPYLLGGYRLTKRFVMGINITPSGYAHVEWPLHSVVANASTTTKLLYYRTGIQSSYQFTDNLAIGLGFNLEHNKNLELDFVVPGMGNQINKVSDLNASVDLGVFYKINKRDSLTAAVYTPVKAIGVGTSTLNTTTVNSTTLPITQAAVAFVGLQHNLTNKWFLGEKVYWSGWSLQKNINFVNTTTGSFIVPTNWRDTWSFQLGTRYATTERITLLGSAIYETNASPTNTNSIGYPLAPVISFSTGLDLTLQKKLTAQVIYGYGLFLPNAVINNAKSNGSISGNFQGVVMQLTYKS